MRQKHMPDHLTFLGRNSDTISIAGPLTDCISSDTAGGLWLVGSDSKDSVQKLVESDPFWPTGLRKSVQILEWKQVFADGKRQI